MTMKKKITFALLAIVTSAMTTMAATIDNDYFSITTPDDSWWVNNDGGALRSIGARAMIYRNDASRHIMELARIDCIDGAFDPQAYLKQQIIDREDVFAKGVPSFSSVGDTVFSNFAAKRVHFEKVQGQVGYHCTALTFNVGFTTFLIIEAHRSGNADVVGWVLGNSLKIKSDATPLNSVSQYVAAATQVLKRHRLPVANNEYLDNVKLSPDSSTVEMEIIIPYTKVETINVPAFVQVMRDHWGKTFKKQVALNSLYAAIVREQKAVRYTYVDNNGYDIGTLLITPPEYNMLLK